MKNRVARVLVVVLTFVVLAAGHWGCGGGGSSSPTAPDVTPAPTARPY